MIEIICKIISKPMAMGMPKTIKYINDSTHATNFIINYQQSKLE